MKTPPSSQSSILAALAGNGFVALIKFFAFLASGSGAMLSEAIHSLADTGNQALLLIGVRRSMRSRDQAFPYGYGGERYVFGLLSASGIFFLGCGVTIYHGVEALLDPKVPKFGPSTFAVLGLSALVEGAVLLYAVVRIQREKESMPFFAYVKEHADPATVAVLLEDSVAVFGLGLAAGGILLSYWTQDPLWDSVASLLVGLMLGLIALYLVIQNRSLLLGRAVPAEVEATFRAILRDWPTVRSVRDLKTRQLTPDDYLFKAEIAFDEALVMNVLDPLLPGAGAVSATDRDRILREMSKRALRAISEEIDAIEAKVRASIPEARHIDLELDRTGLVASKADLPSIDETHPPE